MNASLQPALSVDPSVGPSHFVFFTAPAHPHATKVAVYPALFFCLSGNVEDWLLEVERVMRDSLRKILGDSLEVYPTVSFFMESFYLKSVCSQTRKRELVYYADGIWETDFTKAR